MVTQRGKAGRPPGVAHPSCGRDALSCHVTEPAVTRSGPPSAKGFEEKVQLMNPFLGVEAAHLSHPKLNGKFLVN